MSNAGSGSGDIFDLKKLRRLIELMNEHDLGEMDLRDGEVRVRLRKHGEVVATVESRPASMAHAGTHAQPPVAAAPAAKDEKLLVIKSPMVGTFFASPNPESPAFVKVGDRIGPETTVCIIEAMKVFNEIPAECSGQIAAVLVQNGEPVEYGQPLFKVDPK